MVILKNLYNKSIRLTKERMAHLKNIHPEIKGQLNKIKETLLNPDIIMLSQSDDTVHLYYKYYNKTPVGAKYLCSAVKLEQFIITSYFTDKIKKGAIIWQKRK